MESLYEGIGGGKMIKRLSNLLYRKVLHNFTLRERFQKLSQEKIIVKFIGVMSICLGDKGKKYNKSLKKVHYQHKIKLIEFYIFLYCFKSSLREAGVKIWLIKKLLKEFLLPLKNEIVIQKTKVQVKEVSFYDQIGGEEMTKKLIPIFLNKVRADERVNFYFNVLDMDQLIMTFMGFMSICLGGKD